MSTRSTLGLSIRAFAKLDNCTHTTVRRAIKAGKLPVLADGSIDAKHVGGDWRRENRRDESGTPSPKSSSVPPAGRSTAESDLPDPHDELFAEEANAFIDDVLAGRFRPIGDAERVKENALAAKHLLAARRESGLAVDIELAERVLFQSARTARDAWLSWPSRVAPMIAAKLAIDGDQLRTEMESLVHEHVSDLGEPEARWEEND